MMTETLKNQKALIDAGFSERISPVGKSSNAKRVERCRVQPGRNRYRVWGTPARSEARSEGGKRQHRESDRSRGGGWGAEARQRFYGSVRRRFPGLHYGPVKRGKVPDKTLAEDAPMASRIAGSIGQLAGMFRPWLGAPC